MALPPVAPLQRRQVLGLVAAAALVLFVWRLGSTGLVDETPPLFAAAARAMAETGDWLIPRVNGLPRYDKPPLIYWAMGLLYALPGQEFWNPLGTWAARLPSALGCGAVMLLLADTLLRWPQRHGRPALTALAAALAFGLSPLVLVWGRVAVSDALFSALLSASLLLSWQTYAKPAGGWWRIWLLLGLAVLAKGPVAVLLLGLSLLLFAGAQADLGRLWRRLRPLPGLAITAAVALPWYGAALLKEGESFWRSFFGYHNLQRFTAVVNNHQQPWWFFGLVLVIASLPLTPLLLAGLVQGLGRLHWSGWPRLWRPAEPLAPELSLQRFAACWLLAVLLFFSLAATKLPSYWLPATPAAGLLIALAAPRSPWPWRLTLLLTAVLATGWLASPQWVPAIVAPEMPTLVPELLAGRWLLLGGALYGAAVLLGWWWGRRADAVAGLLALQLPLLAFVPLGLQPAAELGDRLRAAPVRALAAELVRQSRPAEPVAMVGLLKPSLHYYSRRVVIYEGAEPANLVNLAERLRQERRPGQPPSTPKQQPSVLVVIDTATAALPHWQQLEPEQLGLSGIYRLWRLDRRQLEQRAAQLQRQGVAADWSQPRPERY